MSRSSGRIITFYSYKGGTGRSMALANVGWILASRRKRVLMIDWDLEAPGLHRYFHPFLEDKALATSEGIIDFFMRFEEAAAAPLRSVESAEDREASQQWYLPLADPAKYIVPLAWPFEYGTLDLLSAGKQDSSYAARVNSFNWAGFYERLGGGVFIEAMKGKLRDQYDYILVDSRTGVSDTAGICTVQMPDDVVVCFTYNVQSMEGAAAVAKTIRAQRELDAKRAPPLFRIFPVPMRIERAEQERLNRSRDFARDAFAGFIDHINESRRDEYWGEIEVPYVPFYAYQEVLATIGDKAGLIDSLLRSCERISDFVTGADSGQQQVLPGSRREEIKQMFLRGAQTGGVRVALKRHPELQDFSDELVTRQKAWDESKEDVHLLEPAAIDLLRGNTELHIALLEDRGFRGFFEASERRLAKKARIRRFGWANAAFVASFGLLLGTVLFRRSAVGFTSSLWDYLEYALAGMCGTVYVQIVTAARVGADDISSQRPIVSLLNLVTGAAAGLFVLTFIRSALVGFTLKGGASADALSQHLLRLALPFSAGLVSPRIMPTFIARLKVVE